MGSINEKGRMLKKCGANCTHFIVVTQTAIRTKALYTHACMHAHMHARMHARTHAHTHARTHTHNMYQTYTRAAGSIVQFISTNSPCLMKFNKKLKSKDN